MGPDPIDCGLDGADEAPVTIGRYNRQVARAFRHHFMPVRDTTTNTEKVLMKHILDEEKMLAKISGGVTVLKWMLPVLVLLTVDRDNVVLNLIFKAIAQAAAAVTNF